jgi:hypothetical protein
MTISDFSTRIPGERLCVQIDLPSQASGGGTQAPTWVPIEQVPCAVTGFTRHTTLNHVCHYAI